MTEMTSGASWHPSAAQLAFYEHNGYLLLPGMFNEDELRRLDAAILRLAKRPDCQSTDCRSRYPQPSKYTISYEGLLDADLAFLADHPVMLDAAEAILGKQACLSAFVSYLRTPGDHGSAADYTGSSLTAHCDYKPFRPVGSSLNWLFTILPLVDYTPQIGALHVSPGSHKLSRLVDNGTRITHVERANFDELPPLIDARLRRGDLLLMHMFTWHEAPGNRSNQDRWGVYNKYMAIDAPPACGPFLFSDEARDMRGERGRLSLQNHSDRPIGTTRLIIEHDERVLMVRATDRNDPGYDKWTLPGGQARQINVIKDWDAGNVIASLEQHVHVMLGVEIDWMSYVGDWPEDDAICRVYARPLDEPISLHPMNNLETRWVSKAELNDPVHGNALLTGFEYNAIDRWLHEPVMRGIGLSQQRAGLKPHQ